MIVGTVVKYFKKEIISAWSFHARQETNLNEGLPESVKTRELHHVPV